MTFVDDGDLPAVTDQMLEEALPTARAYTAVVLKAGPKYQPPGPDRSETVAKIVREHAKRNYALHRAGLLPIVCPVAMAVT